MLGTLEKPTECWSTLCWAISSGISKVGKGHVTLRSLDLSPIWQEATGAGDYTEIVWSDRHALRALQLLHKGKVCRWAQENPARTLLHRSRWAMMDQELLEEKLIGLADALEVRRKEKRIRDDLWFLAVLCHCMAWP